MAAIEGASRIFDKEPASLEALHLAPKPYMMFVVGRVRNPVWRNAETGSAVPSRMAFNNLGFANDRDFAWPPDAAFVTQFGPQPGEKLIVITGGSAVLGVGATSNERTIAGQLEAVLNERQSRQKYRVLNLGMGSWIAYQQLVGLTLFGLPLAPDWIVTMDAHNDATFLLARKWPRQPHGMAEAAAAHVRWQRLLGGRPMGTVACEKHRRRAACHRTAPRRTERGQPCVRGHRRP